jgi:phosphohistidine phosphatase
MNIYLIRHGDSEKSYLAKSDFARKLTPEGIEQVKSAASGWKSLIKSFDYIVTSPLIRALQTAELVAEVFGYKNQIIVEKKISSGSTTEELAEVANSLNKENIAFVGHEPDFSTHVSNLTSNSGTNIDFKKGAIAKITFHNKVRFSKGVLEFLIPPKVFKEGSK